MKIVDNKKYMSSLELAELLGKKHKNILPSIKKADGIKYINDIHEVRGRQFPCVLLSETAMQMYLTIYTKTDTDTILKVMKAFENTVSHEIETHNSISHEIDEENTVSHENNINNPISHEIEQLNLLNDDNIDSKVSDIDSKSLEENNDINTGKCFGSVKSPIYEDVNPFDFGVNINKRDIPIVGAIKNYEADPCIFVPDSPEIIRLYKKKWGHKYNIERLLQKYGHKYNLKYIIFCKEHNYNYMDSQVVEIDRSLTTHELGEYYEERQKRESKKYVMSAEEMKEFMEMDILPWENEKTKEGKLKKSFGRTKDNDK